MKSINENIKPTFLQNVDMMLNDTINCINIDPNIAKILKICRSVIQVKFPVKINGKIEIFYGWRAMHSNHRLPVKGGLRFSLKVNQEEVEALADVVHRSNNLAASISSGSFRTDGMVVAPCSMKTLSAIVNSSSSNLLIRAADVVLKEQRKLVLMPREAPLHLGHCKLLYEAAQMGAVIAPPMPAFYNSPATVDDIINHSVGRVLDLLDLEVDIVRRWSGMKTKTRSL